MLCNTSRLLHRRACVVNGEKLGVDSRDEGKHTGKNDLRYVGKMMWMDERAQISPTPRMRLIDFCGGCDAGLRCRYCSSLFT